MKMQNNKSRKVGFAPLTDPPSLDVIVLSAGIGACIADTITFPFDTVKVRLQIQGSQMDGAPRYRGLFGTMLTIIRQEGVQGLYGGLIPGLQRQFVFSSLRIGFYEPVKKFYSENTGLPGYNMAIRILSGITTGALAIMVAQPTDVVKVRMQAQGALRNNGGSRYANSMDAYRKIFRHEGLRGYWKGLTPNVGRNSIVNASELVSYDVIKSQLLFRAIMKDTVGCHMTAAAGAGLITTVIASPVDVVKTRYMNAAVGEYNSVFECCRAVAREGGLRAFYKGVVPSFLRIATWNICMFVMFEQLKRGIIHFREQSRNIPAVIIMPKATVKADSCTSARP